MFKHKHRHGKQNRKGKLSLSESMVNRKVTILVNPDRKTVEMGLYPGATASVVKNEPFNPNVIVSVGECRYIIAKSIADEILVSYSDA